MTLTELIAQEKAAQPKAAPKTLTLSELIAKEKVAQQGTTPQVPPGDYASMGPLGKILDVAGREGYAATNVVSKFYEGGSILDVPKNYMAGITAESRKTMPEFIKEVPREKMRGQLLKYGGAFPPLAGAALAINEWAPDRAREIALGLSLEMALSPSSYIGGITKPAWVKGAQITSKFLETSPRLAGIARTVSKTAGKSEEVKGMMGIKAQGARETQWALENIREKHLKQFSVEKKLAKKISVPLGKFHQQVIEAAESVPFYETASLQVKKAADYYIELAPEVRQMAIDAGLDVKKFGNELERYFPHIANKQFKNIISEPAAAIPEVEGRKYRQSIAEIRRLMAQGKTPEAFTVAVDSGLVSRKIEELWKPFKDLAKTKEIKIPTGGPAKGLTYKQLIGKPKELKVGPAKGFKYTEISKAPEEFLPPAKGFTYDQIMEAQEKLLNDPLLRGKTAPWATILGNRKIEGGAFIEQPGLAWTLRESQLQRKIIEKNTIDKLLTYAIKSGHGKTLDEAAREGLLTQFHQYTKLSPIPGLEKYADHVFSPDVVDLMKSYVHHSDNPESINTVLEAYDHITNFWKRWTLLPFPLFHARNMVGNIWNGMLGGNMNPMTYAKCLYKQFGGKKDIKFAGMSWEKFNELAGKQGARRTGFTTVKEFGTDLGGFGQGGRIRRVLDSPFNPLHNLAETGGKVGTIVEDNAKLALFLDGLEKGKSVEEAGATMRKFLFDYGDLTDIEKTLRRIGFPFLAWTRKNLPLQIEAFVTQPEKFQALFKTINAIESGKKPTPNEQRYIAQWMQEQVPIAVNKKPDGTFSFFLAGNWLPPGELLSWLSSPNFKGIMGNLLQRTNPLLKAPIENYFNQSTFFEGQQLEYTPGQKGNFLGLSIGRKTINLLRNIRILNSLDKMNPGTIFGGPGQRSKVADLLGTSQPPERYKTGRADWIAMMGGQTYNYDPKIGREKWEKREKEKLTRLRGERKKARQQKNEKWEADLNEQINQILKGLTQR